MAELARVDRLVSYAIVLNEQGRALLLKRADGPQGLAGLWEPPGGKVDQGEGPLEAAVRELKEEADLEGQPWKRSPSVLLVLPWSGREREVRCVAAYYHLCPAGSLVLHAKWGEVRLSSAHSAYSWVYLNDAAARPLALTPAFKLFLEEGWW